MSSSPLTPPPTLGGESPKPKITIEDVAAMLSFRPGPIPVDVAVLAKGGVLSESFWFSEQGVFILKVTMGNLTGALRLIRAKEEQILGDLAKAHYTCSPGQGMLVDQKEVMTPGGTFRYVVVVYELHSVTYHPPAIAS